MGLGRGKGQGIKKGAGILLSKGGGDLLFIGEAIVISYTCQGLEVFNFFFRRD